MITDAGGNLYAGGQFFNANKKNFVAKWDGTAWSELGGTNSSTFVGVIISVTLDNKGNIYAGGRFWDNNGNGYVAKWNGTAWSELGGSTTFDFSDGINCIATDVNDNVFVGGEFGNSTTFQYVAKYGPTGLPIKLTSITATQENKDIAINWQTATELNTSHFIIQHSTDGSSYKDIGKVKAIGSRANSYCFTDNNPANGINYYRLQSVDKDGSLSFSKVVSAEILDSRYEIAVYPNPAKSSVTVKGNHITSVQVIDNMGRVVKVVSLKDATNPTLSVNGLPAGVYHLRIQTMDGNVNGVAIVVSD